MIQEIAFSYWNASNATVENLASLAELIEGVSLSDAHLGTHFFQPNPSGSGISPVFDYRAASRSGDSQSFILASPNGSLPAPTGPKDVAWLSLARVQGNLATTVMRVNTVAGQPPASVRFFVITFSFVSYFGTVFPRIESHFRQILGPIL